MFCFKYINNINAALDTVQNNTPYAEDKFNDFINWGKNTKTNANVDNNIVIILFIIWFY